MTFLLLLLHLQYIRQDIVLDVFTYFPRQRGGPAEIFFPLAHPDAWDCRFYSFILFVQQFASICTVLAQPAQHQLIFFTLHSPFEKVCCCRSTLETLAQLHGTGLAFKKSVGGNKEILKLFPDLEEQIQIKVYYICLTVYKINRFTVLSLYVL